MPVPQERWSDAQLVLEVAQGNRHAFVTVWERHASFLRGVLCGALGSDGPIEDMLQEVFLAFFRSAGRIRDANSLRGYLTGVAVRMAAHELRKRRVRRWVGLAPPSELPDTPVTPADDEAREALRALDRVLDQLGTHRRLAYVLRYVQALEYSDVASAMGISESTARREVKRAQLQFDALARREPALLRYLKSRGEMQGEG